MKTVTTTEYIRNDRGEVVKTIVTVQEYNEYAVYPYHPNYPQYPWNIPVVC